MQMVYGYCRISTPTQNIDRQKRNILDRYPKAKLFCEAYTGTTTDRPEWCKLKAILKKGDTVVFDEISRMSRNADEGIKLYMELYDKGIELVFLKEPQCNTATYSETLKNRIELAFQSAENEVKRLKERTREGIETARLNGKQIGRKTGSKITTKRSEEVKQIIKAKSKDFSGNMNDVEVIAYVKGITKGGKFSRNSYYKYKAELKAEAEKEQEQAETQ